jgi:hypothetical protein
LSIASLDWVQREVCRNGVNPGDKLVHGNGLIP